MANGSELTATLGLALERVRDGDTYTVSLTERVFSFLIGFKGGTDDKTSRGEGLRFLGTWCPELKDPGGPEAKAFSEAWPVKHDHPKQHAYSKTLVAHVSTEDLRDHFGRVLGLVICTVCGACLNEDLVAAGHATPERVRAIREDAQRREEYAQHYRALSVLKAALGNGKRFGANNLLKMMAGQTSLLQALDEQGASE